MKVEILLDEGEEYPQLFSVWRIDPKTGLADLTTRRNYVYDKEGMLQWLKENNLALSLQLENAELRKFGRDMLRIYFMPSIDSKKREKELLERALKLRVAKDNEESAMIEKGE